MSSYSINIPEDLARKAEEAARHNGVSLNEFLLSAIAHRVGAYETELFFRRLAERADPEAMRRILDRVPHGPPVPGDELDVDAEEPTP